MPGLPCLLRHRDGAPGRPVGAGEPHRGQPLMHHIRADLALRGLHQLLDLVAERVDRLRPRRAGQRVATSVADRDIPGDVMPNPELCRAW